MSSANSRKRLVLPIDARTRLTSVCSVALFFVIVIGTNLDQIDFPAPLIMPTSGVVTVWALASGRRPRDLGWEYISAAVTVVCTALFMVQLPVRDTVLMALSSVATMAAASYVWQFANHQTLRRPHDMFSIALVAVIGAAAGAIFSVAYLFDGYDRGWSVPLLTMLHDASAIFIWVSSWIVLFDPQPSHRDMLTHQFDDPAQAADVIDVRGVRDAAIVAAAVLGETLMLLGLSGVPSMTFLVLPITAVVALTVSLRATVGHTIGVTITFLALAIGGVGAFATSEPVLDLTGVQCLVVIQAALGLTVGLFRQEQHQTELAAFTMLASAHKQTEHQTQVAEDAEAQSDLLDTVFSTTDQGLQILNHQGLVIGQNDVARAMALSAGAGEHGVDQPWDVYTLDGDLVPPHEQPHVLALAGKIVPAGIFVVRATNGWQRIVSCGANPMPTRDGAAWSDGAVVSIRDVTETYDAMTEAMTARSELKAVLDSATQQAIIGVLPDGDITIANPGAARLSGYSVERLMAMNLTSLIDPAELAQRARDLGVEPGFDVLVARCIKHGHENAQWTLATADNDSLDVMISLTTQRDADGELTGFIAVASDITERVRAEARLQDSERLFRQAFDTAPVGMLMLDVDEPIRITRTNTAMCRFVENGQHALVGQPLSALLDITSREDFANLITSLLSHKRSSATAELKFIGPSGGLRWGLVSATLIQPTYHVTPYVLCLVENLTERKAAERQLAYQANHDQLTGLPNRLMFTRELLAMIKADCPEGPHTGLLYIDLDGFKTVNDTAGHEAGDDVLRIIAKRIRETVQPGAVVGRLGGDEFAIACPNTPSINDLERLARQVRDRIDEPIDLAHGTFTVGASIGVRIANNSEDIDAVMRDADAAMYRAKRAGKNQVFSHSNGVDELFSSPSDLATHVRFALDRSQFVVHGQPIVDIVTGVTSAVEALLRWQHPIHGVISPTDFLPAVETTPFSRAVCGCTFRSALRMAAQWGDGDDGLDIPIHINVTARQLHDRQFIADLLHSADEHDISPSSIVLEISERGVVQFADHTMSVIDELHKNQIRVALDDLGMGAITLTTVSELPVDTFKIDKAVIAQLGSGRQAESVVGALVGFGHALNANVIAVGVENSAQHDILVGLGVTHAQGFYYGEPVAADRVMTRIHTAPEHTLPRQRTNR